MLRQKDTSATGFEARNIARKQLSGDTVRSLLGGGGATGNSKRQAYAPAVHHL
jgi:hypothetical protein